MVEPNKWQYCNTTTVNHPLPKAVPISLEKIDQIIKNEGAKKGKISSDSAINLDSAEIELAKKERRNLINTMDFAFAIIKGKQKQMVLIECKFNCLKPINLDKSELEAKIKNSKILLGNSPPIFSTFYFVFQTKIKEEARGRLRRLFENRPNFEAIDINELKDNFFQ